MQIEEAIEKLKETAKQCRNSKECWENEDCCDCYVEVEDIFAIETVLNELEKKDKVIDEMATILTRYMSTFDNKPYHDLSLGVGTRRMTIEEVKQYFSEKVSDNK